MTSASIKIDYMGETLHVMPISIDWTPAGWVLHAYEIDVDLPVRDFILRKIRFHDDLA